MLTGDITIENLVNNFYGKHCYNKYLLNLIDWSEVITWVNKQIDFSYYRLFVSSKRTGE